MIVSVEIRSLRVKNKIGRRVGSMLRIPCPTSDASAWVRLKWRSQVSVAPVSRKWPTPVRTRFELWLGGSRIKCAIGKHANKFSGKPKLEINDWLLSRCPRLDSNL